MRPAPGPGGGKAAGVLAAMLRDPLAGYLRLAAHYGDTVRVPISPRTSIFVLTRPEQAEHVLAANQDNYVKAFTYRPLRALIGNGLLTSEGEDWRRHRRLVQPLFSRRDVRVLRAADHRGDPGHAEALGRRSGRPRRSMSPRNSARWRWTWSDGRCSART